LKRASILELVWITPELEQQAWAIFEKFNTNKYWLNIGHLPIVLPTL
jgi:hypothetical protein